MARCVAVFVLTLLALAAVANAQAGTVGKELVRKTKPFKPVPTTPSRTFTFRPVVPSNASGHRPDERPRPPHITRRHDGSPLVAAASPGATAPRAVVTYRGGPVMHVINVYFIWYGSWDSASKSIHRNFVQSLGFSNPRTPGVSTVSGWWDVVRPYGDRYKNFVGANPVVKGERNDAYSQGNGGTAGLSQDQLSSIVKSAIASGAFPADANGFYAVMTWKDVLVAGWCTEHCGYHTYFVSNNVELKFAYVANRPGDCCSGGKGPNGNADADAAVSILAHELAEAASDPHLNAWISTSNYENGDACAWFFGSMFASNGGVYNMVGRNGQKFLVQQMYDIATKQCITAAAARPPYQLVAQSTLYQNQYLYSPNGRFMAILQVDQNFVLYDGASPGGVLAAKYASKTQFSNATKAVMQTDSNFVLYKAGNVSVWATGTAGAGGNRIVMQDNGNLVIYTAANVAKWASGTNSLDSGNGVAFGFYITAPQYFVSPNYRYKFWVQSDGNLVLYDGAQNKALWASNTQNSGGKYLYYQADGNLVLCIDRTWTRPVWSSNTRGQTAGKLAIQSDGNVVLFTPSNVAYWSTNTVQTV